MFLVADTLGTATWGLVVATALLVVASAIPAIGGILERRRDRHERLAMLVPDLHMLRSRLNGAVRSYGSLGATKDDLAHWIKDISEMQEMLVSLFAAGQEEGLELINELYICRHLLTQSKYSYVRAANDEGEKKPAIERGLHLLIAARTTLDAIEKLLPQRLIKIHGERFWDRFVRLSEEREKTAEGKRLRDLGA